MTSVKRDENRVTVSNGLSNADGATVLSVKANPTTHAYVVDNGLGGSDLTGDNASRDENRVPAFMAVSATDGITPVPIYVDSATGGLLIRSS